MCIFVVSTCVSYFQKYTLNLNSNTIFIFRFDISVDGGGSFKHKSVLAMPIKYSSSPGRVLGVFQLVNKLHDLPFTSNDENFLEAFAIFCGMGISNVRMYETACVAMAKQQVLFKTSPWWNRVKKNALTDSDFLGHSWGSLLPRHCSSWWGHKTFKVELKTIFMRIIHFYFTFICFTFFILDKKFPVQLHFNFIHSSLMTLV